MSYRAQWFSEFGNCQRCGKPATGKLMGYENDPMGNYCKRCAEIEIKDGKRQRAAEKGQEQR